MPDEVLGPVMLTAFIVVVSALMLFVYLLPAIIAGARGHHDTLAITAVTILLGWSLIGWIIALVWSLTAVRRTGA